MKKISIIVPVFNNEKTLDRCIKSILNQTYKDLEVLFVNDGSIDDSSLIIKDYMKRDKMIKLLFQKNCGVSTARNFGIEQSVGDYIGFVDADDWIDLNMYEALMEEIVNRDCDLVLCSFVKENKGVLIKEKLNYKQKLNLDKEFNIKIAKDLISYEDIKKGSLMGSVWRCIFKKSIIVENNIKFKREINKGEDLLFLLDTLPYCKRVSFINKNMYHYMYREESTTEKYSDNLYNEYMAIYKKIINNPWISENLEFNSRLNNLIIRYTASSLKNLFNVKNKESYSIRFKKFNSILDYEPYKKAIKFFKGKLSKYNILKIKSRKVMFVLILLFSRFKSLFIKFINKGVREYENIDNSYTKYI